jgi:hypothetical protein
MSFFGLSAAAPIPRDEIVGSTGAVRHEARHLVSYRLPIHGVKWESDLLTQAGQRLLLKGLTNRHTQIFPTMLRVIHLIGHETNFSICG